MSEKLDFNVQGEWFYDVQRTRTGNKNHCEMATFGFNYHPAKYLKLRPKVRGDFANNQPAFGRNASERSQLTAAIKAQIKI